MQIHREELDGRRHGPATAAEGTCLHCGREVGAGHEPFVCVLETLTMIETQTQARSWGGAAVRRAVSGAGGRGRAGRL